MLNENYCIDLQRITPHLDSPIPVQARFFLKEGVLQKVELAKSAPQDKNVWYINSQSTDNQSIEKVEEWVYVYFNGGPAPDLEMLYPPFAFTRKVLEELSLIPFGKTLSYKEVAERIGRTGSYRAVAGACSRNAHPTSRLREPEPAIHKAFQYSPDFLRKYSLFLGIRNLAAPSLANYSLFPRNKESEFGLHALACFAGDEHPKGWTPNAPASA